jgi:hypothetical protein
MSDLPAGLIASVVAVVAGLVATLAGMVALYERRRAAHYDQERHRAELDLMRRATESKMYELNERLLATEGRWRDANHLLLDSQSYQGRGATASVPMNTFIRSAGLGPKDLEVDPKLVMVLMPFHPDFRDTYEVIRRVCSDVGLKAARGDEDYVEADILRHVLGLLLRARLVIAVVDGRNPNVFYELGIAHALGKPTILVSTETSVTLPFDVRARKVLLANSGQELAEMLAPEITRSLVEG